MATILPRRAGAGSKLSAVPSGGSKSVPEPHALTKPEAQRISLADATLAPYQDEKLEIYRRHHEAMDVAFERARERRKLQHDEYDGKNREIAERLESIKQRTDGEVKRQEDRMKDFSSEFDESVIRQRKEWLSNLASNQGEVGRQGRAIGEDLTALDADIAAEGEACRADTTSETEPLAEELRRHADMLEQQAAGRAERHAEFKRVLATEFGRLRKRLTQEAKAREKQVAETSADLKKRCAELGERLQKQEAMAHEWLQDLQSRLEQERAKRTSSHEMIVQNMTTFMVDFEKHIAETHKMQEATRGTLLGMRTKLRSTDSP
uniref:Uncharacterized protein n=1 Tax=Pyrodinium bahamense TaxID=73915 RepID=A0A7R9ZY85_9DINO|mmetsp:Transcript_14828/g.40986  ORF Transcript_14828/g.40986 Transcript_14828/m.40986 type:complete len:321 (+) Transcript_14828:68-1030(+)